MSKESLELQAYKNAVWQFLIEHSDITDGGSLFVKFHTSGRRNFENRIKGRSVYGYERKDTRLNMTPKEKEELHINLTKIKNDTKKTKREKWKASEEERKRIFAEVKRRNETALMQYMRSQPAPRKKTFINRLRTLYATARIKVLQLFKVG